MNIPHHMIYDDINENGQESEHFKSIGFEYRVLDKNTIEFYREDMVIECSYERFEDSGSVNVIIYGDYPKEENGEPIRHNIIWYAEQDTDVDESFRSKASGSAHERVKLGLELTKQYPGKFLSAEYLFACHESEKVNWGDKLVDLDLPDVEV